MAATASLPSSDGRRCQMRRQQAQANSRSFRSLTFPLLHKKSRIFWGSVQLFQSASVMGFASRFAQEEVQVFGAKESGGFSCSLSRPGELGGQGKVVGGLFRRGQRLVVRHGRRIERA